MSGSAFISYSRDDSEFALRLAQDLKAAGAKVWLDQLDIKPGTSWDNAIEDALLEATHILIILSPASSRSSNVRNEISYALEQGKIIIPVLYTECIVPLQLQRNQRIDFRADYARGLAALLSHLNVTNPDPSVLQKVAEDDAHRKTAWQARDAQAKKIQEIADYQQQEKAAGTSHAAQAVPLAETQRRVSISEPIQDSRSTPQPRKPWWRKLTVQIALAGVIVVAGVTVAAMSAHHGKNVMSLYQEAVADDSRKNYTDAAPLYRQACNLGDAKSCTALASLYEMGNGVPKKPDFAVALYDKSCDGGDYVACSTLGKRYYTGDGVQKSLELAYQYDYKACNGGDLAGCSHLGILYVRGEGVEKDLAHAIALFQKACDGNDPAGCSVLGKHYAEGDGVPKDMKKAADLDQKACDGGHASSCTRLADLYRAGEGVGQDIALAKQLYQKGCILGDQKACDAWLNPVAK